MTRLLTLALLAAAPHAAAAAASRIQPVLIAIPGTNATLPGYAVYGRQRQGVGKAFPILAEPIVARRGSPYMGENWLLSKMLVKSAQDIAPLVSGEGVAMAKIGTTVILMPRDGERGPETKIAVIRAGDSRTYLLTTMDDLAKAYAKAEATRAGAGFGFFDVLFDGSDRRALPGLPGVQSGDIPLGPGTHMRPSEWQATRELVERIISR